MRWRTVLGREVVDTSIAEGIGGVDTLVLDPAAHAVVGIVVGDRVVSWSDAGGIGSDAVTIGAGELLHDPRSDPERKAIDGRGDPLAKRVLTEDGLDLGTTADVEFDPETGAVVRLVLDDDHVAGARLLGVGSFAVMVSSIGVAVSGGDLAGLTKSELYEMARARDIDGRSTMTKDELIAAVR